jgi:outer membrane translocation and assembly module TamA
VVVGAEVSSIINLEVEQALTRELSLIGFVDAGLTGLEFDSWPGNEWRVSIGLGLRYNTIIGPARLEYGRNVVRQTGDSLDAWHFALGFPF